LFSSLLFFLQQQQQPPTMETLADLFDPKAAAFGPAFKIIDDFYSGDMSVVSDNVPEDYMVYVIKNKPLSFVSYEPEKKKALYSLPPDTLNKIAAKNTGETSERNPQQYKLLKTDLPFIAPEGAKHYRTKEGSPFVLARNCFIHRYYRYGKPGESGDSGSKTQKPNALLCFLPVFSMAANEYDPAFMPNIVVVILKTNYRGPYRVNELIRNKKPQEGFSNLMPLILPPNKKTYADYGIDEAVIQRLSTHDDEDDEDKSKRSAKKAKTSNDTDDENMMATDSKPAKASKATTAAAAAKKQPVEAAAAASDDDDEDEVVKPKSKTSAAPAAAAAKKTETPSAKKPSASKPAAAAAAEKKRKAQMSSDIDQSDDDEADKKRNKVIDRHAADLASDLAKKRSRSDEEGDDDDVKPVSKPTNKGKAPARIDEDDEDMQMIVEATKSASAATTASAKKAKADHPVIAKEQAKIADRMPELNRHYDMLSRATEKLDQIVAALKPIADVDFLTKIMHHLTESNATMLAVKSAVQDAATASTPAALADATNKHIASAPTLDAATDGDYMAQLMHQLDLQHTGESAVLQDLCKKQMIYFGDLHLLTIDQLFASGVPYAFGYRIKKAVAKILEGGHKTMDLLAEAATEVAGSSSSSSSPVKQPRTPGASQFDDQELIAAAMSAEDLDD